MSVTLDTSHFEMPLLNSVAFSNIWVISVTLDTSHFPIGPCAPLTQSPTGDISKHATTAARNLAPDKRGAGGGEGIHEDSPQECTCEKKVPKCRCMGYVVRLGLEFRVYYTCTCVHVCRCVCLHALCTCVGSSGYAICVLTGGSGRAY